jgi:hypothetical protein
MYSLKLIIQSKILLSKILLPREDPGKNASSTSPCVSQEASEWGGPSDETGKNEAKQLIIYIMMLCYVIFMF